MGWTKIVAEENPVPGMSGWGACVAGMALALTAGWSARAGAQDARTKPAPQLIPRTQEEREQRYASFHRIVLNLEVTDGSGKPVRGLKAKDFTLLDDEKPEVLRTFQAVEEPVAAAPPRVILLLDEVNGSGRDLGNDRRGIESYLRASPERLEYPTAIAVLSETGIEAGQFSQDREAVRDEVKGLHLQPMFCPDDVEQNPSIMAVWEPTNHRANPVSAKGLSCLNRRFITSVTALERFANEQMETPGRVILIWLGTGWPLLYDKQFQDDNEHLKDRFFDHLVEVSNALRRGQVTLDMLLPLAVVRKAELLKDHENAFFDGVPNRNEATAASLGLQALAHQSGGQLLIGAKDVPKGIEACVADVRTYYVVTFDSAVAAGPGEYHPLAVKVDRDGVKVRTNLLYYAEQ